MQYDTIYHLDRNHVTGHRFSKKMVEGRGLPYLHCLSIGFPLAVLARFKDWKAWKSYEP
jgi:hypothetical protein